MANHNTILKKLDLDENVRDRHTYIEEKIVLDLVNGVNVVARDLNNSSKNKEKGFARIIDSVTGDSKKRQNLINENLIEGFNAATNWLHDHDKQLSKVDLKIKGIADELYRTQDEISKFYSKFKDAVLDVKILQKFHQDATNKFKKIENRLVKIEAQQHIDREIKRLGSLNLPLEIEVFTVLDNLASGEFGIWYSLTDDSRHKEQLFTYIQDSLKEKIDGLNDNIDIFSLHREIGKLDVSEQKTLSFISKQYRSFASDTYYDSIDIVVLASSIRNEKEFESAVSSASNLRTFISKKEYIDDMLQYLLAA